MNTFRKGDAAKRALFGPLGLFVGTTNLSYRVVVKDGQGGPVLDEQMRAVVRGDRESLDISDTIAKTICHRLRKLRGKTSAMGD